jgi:hypothetical protein
VLEQCFEAGFPEISGSFLFCNVIPTDGGSMDIIQVGVGNCRAPNCPGGMEYYVGWGRSHTTPGCSAFSDVAPILNGVGAWTNASHIYRVQYSSNAYRMFVDQALVSNVIPANICWAPRSAVWFGESWDAGDQIGGDHLNRISITQASTQQVADGAFSATSFIAANPCTYVASFGAYHCDVTGSRSLDIWTDR